MKFKPAVWEAAKRSVRAQVGLTQAAAFVACGSVLVVRLQSEDVAEFAYQPTKCNKTYRIVVLRKNLSVEKGEKVLFDDIEREIQDREANSFEDGV